MFRRLLSSNELFKTVEFKDGLNLLVAETTHGSTGVDSRNGVGKSSLIEVLHFLLGGNTPRTGVLARSEIKDFDFRLRMDWPSTATGHVDIYRSLSDPAGTYVEPPLRRLSTLAEGATRYTASEWQHAIERDLFDLPAEHSGISGRAMLSLYMRRVGSNAFNDVVKTHPQQSLAEASANIAYLLGLDWQLVSRYRDLSARESARKKLKEASKDPILGRIVGRASELRGQISVTQDRVSNIERQVQSFKVVPEYERLQREADKIAQSIRRMRTDDAVDRRNLQDIEAAIEEVVEPQIGYLQQVYEELGIT